jgi:predicted DNA binding CopG/RHH family protein
MASEHRWVAPAPPADDLDELNAELDRAIDEGGFRPLGERARRTGRTVPISLRLPETLLGALRLEAARRRMSYQRLLKQLVEEGLQRPARPRTVHPGETRSPRQLARPATARPPVAATTKRRSR